MAYPIDTARLTLIAMSGARPGASYAEKADGTTQYVPGQQGLDRATGLPLWEVDAVMPAAADDERGRANLIKVRIASRTAPEVTIGMPVVFADLEMSPRVDRKSGQLGLSFTASAVVAPSGRQARSETAA